MMVKPLIMTGGNRSQPVNSVHCLYSPFGEDIYLPVVTVGVFNQPRDVLIVRALKRRHIIESLLNLIQMFFRRHICIISYASW